MPNAKRPPMTPAMISSNGRLAPRRISIGRRTLSIEPTSQRPHQQQRRRDVLSAVVEPADGAQHRQHGSELGDAEHEHRRDEQRGIRRAGDEQCQRRPARSAPARVTTMPSATARIERAGEDDGRVALLAEQPEEEPPDALARPSRRSRTGSRRCHGEHQMQHQPADGADLADQPGAGLGRIGGDAHDQALGAAAAPLRSSTPTTRSPTNGKPTDPRGRRRKR